MRRLLIHLALALVVTAQCSCGRGNYAVYQFDNGDDYVEEGVRRIVDGKGRMGFADESGRVAIRPRFAFAFPFADGVAKVTDVGRSVSDGEHSRWESDAWYYVDHSGRRVSPLEERLRLLTEEVDGRVGVAVISDGTDTIMVHGREAFPMLSVFKFPQALAVARHCIDRGIAFSDSVSIRAEEVEMNTWSPMREKYGVRDMRLPVSELLAYSVQQSDNNACDILFRLIGGPQTADSLMHAMGFEDIHIWWTESDMHRDLDLCYENSSTPIAMASLFDSFNSRIRYEGVEYEYIARLAETCATGKDRLAAGLPAAGPVLGHKTGTGDRNVNGQIIAVNDAGYVLLPDGRRYSIVVFVSDAYATPADLSALIARISRAVCRALD